MSKKRHWQLPGETDAAYAERVRQFYANRDRWSRLVQVNDRLEHSAKTICWVNSLHFNPNRIDSFVGMRKMSRLTGGLGRSTIKRQHDAIVAEGLALILQTKSGNRFDSNRFIPLLDKGLVIPDVSGEWVLVEVGKGIVMRSHNEAKAETPKQALFRTARERFPGDKDIITKLAKYERIWGTEIVAPLIDDAEDMDDLCRSLWNLDLNR